MRYRGNGNGRQKIRSEFYERQPYHYNSNKGRHAKLNSLMQKVWDRALMPRGARAMRPADDEASFDGLDGEE